MLVLQQLEVPEMAQFAQFIFRLPVDGEPLDLRLMESWDQLEPGTAVVTQVQFRAAMRQDRPGWKATPEHPPLIRKSRKAYETILKVANRTSEAHLAKFAKQAEVRATSTAAVATAKELHEKVENLTAELEALLQSAKS